MQRFPVKIMTILGTRPEIIRLCLVIKRLDETCEHTLVHTGQNFDPRLNDIFFEELGVRKPDYVIDSKAESFGGQLAIILREAERILTANRPDRVLILGDTNTDLSVMIVERMGIPVYHMEAGNRCFDRKVPEEVNRRLIDATATYNLPYTPGSRENLLQEGAHRQRVFVTGNPIYEVFTHFRERIERSEALRRLGVAREEFVLVTAHRSENVDVERRLRNIVEALEIISREYDLNVVVSCHPRTRDKLEKFGVRVGNPRVRICEPFGFLDFAKLEMNARCVLTDSGTVQEECSILRVPAVIIRDSTERPETIECGASMVSGLERDDILRCFAVMMQSPRDWPIPTGYSDLNVSQKVIQYLLGKPPLLM
jgi:UDP-N-acetylglucosamine 2-epimerase (non-hydrolysing)